MKWWHWILHILLSATRDFFWFPPLFNRSWRKSSWLGATPADHLMASIFSRAFLNNIYWRDTNGILCALTFSGQRDRSHVNSWRWFKFIQAKKKFLFFLFQFLHNWFKILICLYTRRFYASHCPHDTFWLHFANSPRLCENLIWVQTTWIL